MIELILAKLAEKTTRYIVIALTAIIVLIGTYVKGRTDGYSLAEGKYAKEVITWQAKVDQVRFEAQMQIQDILNLYHAQYKQYQDILDIISSMPLPIPPEVDCKIPKGFIVVHNNAADGQPIPSTVPGAGQLTNKKLSDVGRVVATNYYECNAIRAQLAALQDIVKTYQQKQKALVRK